MTSSFEKEEEKLIKYVISHCKKNGPRKRRYLHKDRRAKHAVKSCTKKYKDVIQTN